MYTDSFFCLINKRILHCFSFSYMITAINIGVYDSNMTKFPKRGNLKGANTLARQKMFSCAHAILLSDSDRRKCLCASVDAHRCAHNRPLLW